MCLNYYDPKTVKGYALSNTENKDVKNFIAVCPIHKNCFFLICSHK